MNGILGDEEGIDPTSEELATTDEGDTGEPSPSESTHSFLANTIKAISAKTEPGSEMDIDREAPTLKGLIGTQYEDYKNVEADYEKLLKERQAAIAPMEKQLAETEQKMAQLKPPTFDTGELDYNSWAQQTHQAVLQVGHALMGFIALAPLLASRNGAVGMNMLGLAMQGYAMGHNELAKEAERQYDKHTEVAIRKMELMNQEYKDTVEQYGHESNALRLAIQTKAKEFKDPMTHDAATMTAIDKNVNHLFDRLQALNLSVAHLKEMKRVHDATIGRIDLLNQRTRALINQKNTGDDQKLLKQKEAWRKTYKYDTDRIEELEFEKTHGRNPKTDKPVKWGSEKEQELQSFREGQKEAGKQIGIGEGEGAVSSTNPLGLPRTQ